MGQALSKHPGGRPKICGVGVNDADYNITSYIDGKRVLCPYYRRWHNMITRCYSGRDNAYINTTVCDEWLSFMNFREWMLTQDWQSKYLDKDLKIPGNKEYHPDKCMFISNEANTLIWDGEYTNSALPMGVCFDKSRNKYKAEIKRNGKKISIGRYNSVQEARTAYLDMKRKLIHEFVERDENKSIKRYILTRFNYIYGIGNESISC